MSKTKPITPTIAKILAEIVRKKLSAFTTEIADKHKKTIAESKEFDQFEKLRNKEYELRKLHDELERKNFDKYRDKERELKKLREALEQKIIDKYSTPLMRVRLTTVYSDRPASIYIKENEEVSVEKIRDSILLEDYFSNSPVTHDELVDKLVKKFLS
jgi:exonuclease VII large subunit